MAKTVPPLKRGDSYLVTEGSWQGCSECLIRGFDCSPNGDHESYRHARPETVASFLRRAANSARAAKPVKLGRRQPSKRWVGHDVRWFGHDRYAVDPDYVNFVRATCGQGGEWRFALPKRGVPMLVYFKNDRALAYVATRDEL